ncbi:MAG: hypothetical protein AAB879_01140 [Patescibacteria group bacterium]
MDILLQLFNLLLITLVVFLLYVHFTGAPYLPTKQEGVEEMVRYAHVTPGLTVADIGSGDGRIVIAFGRARADAHGFEINPILVWISRWRIRRAGLEDHCHIHFANLWRVDFSPFKVVTLFGITGMMPKIQSKLQRELAPGSRVISYIFRFPEWKRTEQSTNISVYIVAEKLRNL